MIVKIKVLAILTEVKMSTAFLRGKGVPFSNPELLFGL